MYLKNFLAPVGLIVADVVSAAKIRFAQWYSESSYFTSSVGGIMGKTKPEQSNPYCSPSS